MMLLIEKFYIIFRVDTPSCLKAYYAQVWGKKLKVHPIKIMIRIVISRFKNNVLIFSHLPLSSFLPMSLHEIINCSQLHLE